MECWIEAFGTVPGVTIGIARYPGGPFIRFMEPLLNDYADAILKETQAKLEKIRAELEKISAVSPGTSELKETQAKLEKISAVSDRLRLSGRARNSRAASRYPAL